MKDYDEMAYIDKPLYTTSEISHILNEPTLWVRRQLKRLDLWTGRTRTKQDNRLTASYRDVILLEIDRFLTAKDTPHPKHKATIEMVAKNNDFFTDPSYVIEVDGRSFGQAKRRFEDGRLAFAEWIIDERFPGIVTHPGICFGAPRIKGRRIKTEMLYRIHQARKPKLSSIGWEYEIDDIDLIDQAIRFEHSRRHKDKIHKMPAYKSLSHRASPYRSQSQQPELRA